MPTGNPARLPPDIGRRADRNSIKDNACGKRSVQARENRNIQITSRTTYQGYQFKIGAVPDRWQMLIARNLSDADDSDADGCLRRHDSSGLRQESTKAWAAFATLQVQAYTMIHFQD